MSTLIMSACWPLQGMSIAQKSVIISLADNANDEGVCWPSVAKIAMRTCMSERAVQSAIRWLVESRILSKDERKGRSTVFTITPAAYAPPHMPHPTPADAAPRTVKEPKVEPSKETTSLVTEVFDHWRVKMSSPRSKMDSNRRTLITNALKLYPADVLKLAIDGCAGSTFHMGKNDTGKKYNGLDLILRNAEKIDGFVARAETPEKSGKSGHVAFDSSTQNYEGTPDEDVADFLR
jgi:hypothetical protein